MSRCVCLLSAAECAGVQEMALGPQSVGWLPSHPQLLSPTTAAALPAGARLPGLMPRSAGTHREQEDSGHTQQEPPSKEQLSSHPDGGQGQVLHKDRAGIQGKETF